MSQFIAKMMMVGLSLTSLQGVALAQDAAQSYKLPRSSQLAIALNAALPVASGDAGFTEVVKKGVFTQEGQAYLVVCTTLQLPGRAPGQVLPSFQGCKVDAVEATPDDVASVSLLQLVQKAAH